ncbi:MAG: serine hydroxymethyltransferase [Candidatus Shapirobacteria bacterium]|nr:serine hydroxymethyltransferase [Candidatus Shapirobacteria bacterium]MDD5073813.1 serine hydroxymethyltransferase [Candidatus Shapirobacteria bacterium]MDD5481502.1 serine hydroxymethyltransferase [Candidatus Shapirobacteria bacterium]
MTKQVFQLIKNEVRRQKETLMMIPSENYASRAVLKALGSAFQNKYAEGYPGRRYYQGQKFVDEVENLTIKLAKRLFGVPRVNVQAYSGSPANAAVYFALLDPGDKIMGPGLLSGGHLTHGHPKITFSGKYFNSVQYQVGEDGLFDYEKIERQALKERPKIIIAGTTSYSRTLDFAYFGKIADRVGAYLMADIAHIVALVIAGVHPSPVPYADVITTTTHKSLRGPRGAMILTTRKGLLKDRDLAKKINRAVFPGLQGGPHENNIAAIAVALEEAGQKDFKQYARQIVNNASCLSGELANLGFSLVSGGTDNHLMVIDLRNKNIDGKRAALLLEEAGIIVNANSIPHDPRPPLVPSGIRLGTPALTTRGMKEEQMVQIARWIGAVISGQTNPGKIKQKVEELTKKFPAPGLG